MQLCVLYLVLLLNACCSLVSCLYLYMGHTETKCFLKDVAMETKIVGNYRAQLKEGHLPAPQILGMLVDVKDPDKRVILSRQYGSEGRFTFMSQTPGKHQICLHSNSSSFAVSPEDMLWVHLDIHVEKKSLKDRLNELQHKIEMLTEQVNQINLEINYQKYREERFTQTSESTLNRVWSSILCTLMGIVAIAVLNSRTFKSLNVIEAQDSQTFLKPDIFINLKPKELIIPKSASSHVSYIRL
ncbi:transmembrane emp24 domain-containing protein 9-like [Gadus macrocephalus]|uniref:transmembrane emp24 domain-containing protein 9-like n=1 Tax=Gadus macrocephalus TaxID=80720 RepID=UPI0028CB3CF1|nr:transmembrane emp24 domain-containing protein 9-like [Gadus macrocephalus]